MMRIPRLAVAALALALLVAACGGDDDTADTGAAAETTTSAPSEPTTTAAAATTTTTAAETTTTTAETTTTVAAATTTTAATEAPADASALVAAKVDAAVAAAPADWTSTPVESDLGAAGSDEIYGECTGPDAFDLADLADATAAIATVEINGVQDPTSFFPPPSVSIEARVFESSEVAADAFAVLETVVGTDEGRNCLLDQFVSLIGEGSPDEAEFDVSVEAVEVPGADVGTRLNITASAEGITLGFVVDLVAALDGDCTVYSTFFTFGEEIDPQVRDAIFAAAASA